MTLFWQNPIPKAHIWMVTPAMAEYAYPVVGMGRNLAEARAAVLRHTAQRPHDDERSSIERDVIKDKPVRVIGLGEAYYELGEYYG